VWPYDAVQGFWRSWYFPANVTLYIVGDFGEQRRGGARCRLACAAQQIGAAPRPQPQSARVTRACSSLTAMHLTHLHTRVAHAPSTTNAPTHASGPHQRGGRRHD
jgi:hypothetical protein